MADTLTTQQRERDRIPSPLRANPAPCRWQALLAALLSGVCCWFWLLPQLTSGDRPQAAPSTSELTEVAPDDIPAAMATIDPSSSLAASLKQPGRCGQKLASITVVRQPGDPSGTIRLRSGAYFSPIFQLPDTPIRVALPYPAPYGAGHGSISVLAAGGAVTVALTPPLHVSSKAGSVERNVTWHPTGSCARGNG